MMEMYWLSAGALKSKIKVLAGLVLSEDYRGKPVCKPVCVSHSWLLGVCGHLCCSSAWQAHTALCLCVQKACFLCVCLSVSTCPLSMWIPVILDYHPTANEIASPWPPAKVVFPNKVTFKGCHGLNVKCLHQLLGGNTWSRAGDAVSGDHRNSRTRDVGLEDMGFLEDVHYGLWDSTLGLGLYLITKVTGPIVSFPTAIAVNCPPQEVFSTMIPFK